MLYVVVARFMWMFGFSSGCSTNALSTRKPLLDVALATFAIFSSCELLGERVIFDSVSCGLVERCSIFIVNVF